MQPKEAGRLAKSVGSNVCPDMSVQTPRSIKLFPSFSCSCVCLEDVFPDSVIKNKNRVSFDVGFLSYEGRSVNFASYVISR